MQCCRFKIYSMLALTFNTYRLYKNTNQAYTFDHLKLSERDDSLKKYFGSSEYHCLHVPAHPDMFLQYQGHRENTLLPSI